MILPSVQQPIIGVNLFPQCRERRVRRKARVVESKTCTTKGVVFLLPVVFGKKETKQHALFCLLAAIMRSLMAFALSLSALLSDGGGG